MRLLKLATIAWLAFFATVSLPTNAKAAVDMFLEIPGAPGESNDDSRRGTIDVLAWSWGGSTDRGRFCVQNLAVTKWVDTASGPLLASMVGGSVFEYARLYVRRAGGTPLEYITLELRDVRVSTLSTGGSGGEDRLTENITLDFASGQLTYIRQDERGVPLPPITTDFVSERCQVRE